MTNLSKLLCEYSKRQTHIITTIDGIPLSADKSQLYFVNENKTPLSIYVSHNFSVHGPSTALSIVLLANTNDTYPAS